MALLKVKRVHRETLGGILKTAATTTVPEDGDRLALESVADFDPDGGDAVFLGGTAETFSYTGIDEDSDELTGVTRPNTNTAHALGTKVQAGTTAEIETLADGLLDEDDAPVFDVAIPGQLWPFFSVGARVANSEEIVPVEIDEDGEAKVAEAPDDPDFEGGYITVGSITAEKLNVTTLSAITANFGTMTAGTLTGLTITGALIQSATSGRRIEIDGTGQNDRIKFYNTAGTYIAAIQIDATTNSLIIDPFSGQGSELDIKGPTYVAGAGSLAALTVGRATDNNNILSLRTINTSAGTPPTNHCWVFYDTTVNPNALKAKFPNGVVKTFADAS